MSRYKLLVDLPFLPKGVIYEFDSELGFVKRDGAEYHLREGLAGYLWLLRTEPKYMRRLRGEQK